MTIHHRAFALTDLRAAEGRTLLGSIVPWAVEIRVGGYRESFARGAFTGTDPAAVPLLVAHRHAALPIGRAVALHDEPDRLAGEFALSATREADEVLALAADGVPLGLSVGFAPAPGGDRWNADRSAVTRTRAQLGEVSVVALGAYPGARVEAVRAADQLARRPRLALALGLR